MAGETGRWDGGLRSHFTFGWGFCRSSCSVPWKHMTQKSASASSFFVVKYIIINILHPPAFQSISHNALLLPSRVLPPLTSFFDYLMSVISLTAVYAPLTLEGPEVSPKLLEIPLAAWSIWSIQGPERWRSKWTFQASANPSHWLDRPWSFQGPRWTIDFHHHEWVNTPSRSWRNMVFCFKCNIGFARIGKALFSTCYMS